MGAIVSATKHPGPFPREVCVHVDERVGLASYDRSRRVRYASPRWLDTSQPGDKCLRFLLVSWHVLMSGALSLPRTGSVDKVSRA